MANSTANFCLTSNFNPNYDITWSFQYSVTGNNTTSGGFSTFLFDNNTLDGGGILSGLGYAPYTGYSGVNGAVLGVMFYSNNTVVIKKGTSFSTLTSFYIPQLLYPLVKTSQVYNTIRFNLTDVGQTLSIDVKDQKDNYINVASIPTSLTALNDIYYKVGFSYSAPLNVGDNNIVLSFKDIHVKGQTGAISYIISPKPP